MISNKKGFTLVELIVVMSVLSILWTIALISFGWYSKTARDSVRVADINSIKKSIELYYADKGNYPLPSNPIEITYSWATVWTQGTVWQSVIDKLTDLSEVFLDPLFWSEYTYSITKTDKEFELWAVIEWKSLTNNIVNTVSAENDNYRAYIKGTYNKKIVKAIQGNTIYLFAVPSIISSDLSDPEIMTIAGNNSFVYSWFNNLPSNIDIPNIENTGDFISSWDSSILVYSWDINDLLSDVNQLDIFATNLKSVYNGSDLSELPLYKKISSMDIADQNEVNLVIAPIVNNILGGNMEVVEQVLQPVIVEPACITNPTDESFFTFNESTKSITDYNPAWGSDVVIPCTINGIEITTLWHYAFRTNSLTSIIIPDSVTNIKDYVFDNNSLTSFTIPEWVTNIWKGAFSNNSLTGIVIPDGVTSMWHYAFRYNNLTSITIPDSVTYMWDYIFDNNDLVSVSIWSGLTTVQRSAFSNNNLTSIDIPSNITSLWHYVFRYNELVSITIPSSITSIWNYVFWNQTNSAWNWTVYWPASGYVYDAYVNNSGYKFDKTKLPNYPIPE